MEAATPRLIVFLYVCLGGAAGSGARYLLTLALPSKSFPTGTLAVNVIGSFLMGFVLTWGLRHQWSPAVTTAIVSGVLGGFTTYSAFNQQFTALFQNGSWRTSLVYVALTLVGCMLAGLAGYALGATR
jgi:CrcB protein